MSQAQIDPDYLAHICGEIEYHLAGLRAKRRYNALHPRRKVAA